MSCRCYFSALNSICSVYMIRAAKKGNLQGRWVGEGKKYFSGKGSLPTPFDLFPNQDCLQLPKHLNSMGGHGFNGSTGGCHGYFPCPCTINPCSQVARLIRSVLRDQGSKTGSMQAALPCHFACSWLGQTSSAQTSYLHPSPPDGDLQ